MTFTRAVFGPRGNLPHAVLAWLTSVAFEAINCIFGVFALLALAAKLGLGGPGHRRQGRRHAWSCSARRRRSPSRGHATMVYLQRVLRDRADARAAARARATALGDVRLVGRRAAELTAWETVAGDARRRRGDRRRARSPTSTTRPTGCATCPAGRPAARVFWTVFASSGAIALVLAALGVLLASRGDMSDPIARRRAVRARLAVRRCSSSAAVGGAIANNVVDVLLLRAVPAVARAAAAALPGDGAGHASSPRRWSSTSCSCATSRRCCNDFVALLVVWLAPVRGGLDHRRRACAAGATTRRRSTTSAGRRALGLDARRAAGSRCWPASPCAC